MLELLLDFQFAWPFYVGFFVAYLIGSIPFGLIFTKLLMKKDLRAIGSGNIGATNALRTGNKLVAILTLLGDFMKAFLPVAISGMLFGENMAVLVLLGTILGHIYSIYLKFKGGKGIACFFGGFIAFNWIVGGIALLIWLSVAFITKYSSLAALVAVALTPFTIYLIDQNTAFLFISIIVSALIILSHRDNIRRLMRKEETKIKF